MLTFRKVASAQDPNLGTIRALFIEYSTELGIDLCFQGFQEELETLPGKYSPPAGALLAIESDGEVIGCGAIRALDHETAELKRIYIRPEHRGKGHGERTTAELIEQSQSMGYRVIRLDTLRRLKPAVKLYEKLGFVEIPAYNFNPEADIVYFELVVD